MKARLKIDQATIFQALQRHYSLAIARMNFLLRGWGGDCFVATTTAGARYFLKFHDETDPPALAASSRGFYLPLMDQLHHKGILPHIPHPLATLHGELSLSLPPYEVVITNFIPAKLVGFRRLPDAILIRLAELTGILHRSKSQLEIKYPFIDTFQIEYENLLLKTLARLEGLTAEQRPGKQALRNLVLPRRNQIFKALERQKELQTCARQAGKETVVCHTDLHGGNLMIDDPGNLYLLDWENAILAPAEHDLFFFLEDERFGDLFFPAYQASAGPVDLDVKIFEFYFYRRAFEDLIDLMLRILKGDGSHQRDQEDLDEVRGFLDGFASLEKILAKVRTGSRGVYAGGISSV